MKQGATITVVLVDDHAVVREGYLRLLESAGDVRVVGEAASAAEACKVAAQCRPDVVVMDISLPDMSGIEGMRRLLARDPGIRVLMFSIHNEPIFPRRAFAAGARGYVTKASAPDVLVDAVRTVASGEPFLSPDIAQSLALEGMTGNESDLASLSPREFEVARMLALGQTVSEIAGKLSLSVKTVANHQSHIRQKLGAQSATQFMRIATDSGLVTGAAGGANGSGSEESL
jgi:DNA-binding NarL/FixJ family response regulator